MSYVADMSKHDTTAFGRAFRAAREAAGKSQGDVAKRLGLSTAYISDIERGTRTPLTLDRLTVAADYLEADLKALLLARALWHGVIEVPLSSGGRDLLAVSLSFEALTKHEKYPCAACEHVFISAFHLKRHECTAKEATL